MDFTLGRFGRGSGVPEPQQQGPGQHRPGRPRGQHAKDARAIGETEQRIYSLAAWRETPYFSPRERAALAFTETVTRLSDTHVPDQAYQEVAAEFDPQEVAALVSLIVTINAWNAIGVSTRAWIPGSYQP